MREFLHELGQHVRAQWRMKLWLGTVLTLLFFIGYLTIGRHPLHPPRVLPLSAIDRAIDFSPAWTWAYLSFYLLLPMAWLATTREQLWRYAAGFVSISALAFAIFLIWPVAGPRPQATPVTGVYAWLISWDTSLNTLPSLHIACAVFTTCFAAHVAGPRTGVLTLPLALWTLLIGYSALATKQHYFIDLPAGAALGWLTAAIAFRRRHTAEAPRLPYAKGVTT